MRKSVIALIVVLVAASAYHLWTQRADLAVYWREWSSFQRHLTWQDGQLDLRKPFLSKSISKLDPEAAAIVEWIQHEEHEDFKDVEYLSEMALSYPENQYFLHSLACTVAEKGYTDPQMVDLLADRLLELDPDNGRYYFLKAWAAFYDWRPDRVEKALDYLERCFSGRQQEPFDSYKARVSALIEKEKPFAYLATSSSMSLSGDTFLSDRLIDGFLEYTQDLIVNGRTDEAMRIHDRLQRIAETSIPQTIQEPWRFWISFQPGGYTGLSSNTPQTLELKWMQLTPERAKQNRMQMLGWRTLTERISAMHQESKPKPQTDYEGHVLHLVPPGAHCFELTIAAAAALAGFVGIGLLFRMQPSRVPVYRWIGAIMFSSLYFLLCRFGDYSQMHQICGSGHYTYDYILMSTNILMVLAALKEFVWLTASLLIVTGAIGAVGFLFYWRKPSRPRFIIIYAASLVFIFLLWLTVSHLNYIVPVLHAFVLWLVVPIICLWPPEKGQPFTGICSRANEGQQFRARCVVICGYLLILHLIGFGLLGRSALTQTLAAVERQRTGNTWPAFTPPRFEIKPEQYSNLLHQLKTQKASSLELGVGIANVEPQLQYLLPMVEPTDIPAVLTSIRQNRQNDPNYRGDPEWVIWGPEMPDKPIRYLPELARAMENCGKDALPEILPFVEEPDSPVGLIVRGSAGDISVHDRLVESWKKFRDAGFPEEEIKLNGTSVPLESLARICPYSEFKTYLLESARHFGIETNHFHLQSLIKYFSANEKGDLIRELLKLEENETIRIRSDFGLLRENFEAEPAVKGRLWKMFIDYANKQAANNWSLDLNAREKPSDCQVSDELLNACMNSGDATVRAMGQHIYRVMGKPVSEQMVEQWRNDTYLTIRANAVLLDPKQQASEDPSHFVRLISTLAKRTKT